MNQAELAVELKRMAVFAREANELDAPEKAVYMAEAYRKFGWMPSGDWAKVITYVIDHHRTRSLPQIYEISKAITTLYELGTLKKNADASCRQCAGTGFEYITGVVQADMTERPFCTPCRRCRREAAIKEKRSGIVWDEASYRHPFAEANRLMQEIYETHATRKQELALATGESAAAARVAQEAGKPVDPNVRVAAASTLELNQEELDRLEALSE